MDSWDKWEYMQVQEEGPPALRIARSRGISSTSTRRRGLDIASSRSLRGRKDLRIVGWRRRAFNIAGWRGIPRRSIGRGRKDLHIAGTSGSVCRGSRIFTFLISSLNCTIGVSNNSSIKIYHTQPEQVLVSNTSPLKYNQL